MTTKVVRFDYKPTANNVHAVGNVHKRMNIKLVDSCTKEAQWVVKLYVLMNYHKEKK